MRCQHCHPERTPLGGYEKERLLGTRGYKNTKNEFQTIVGGRKGFHEYSRISERSSSPRQEECTDDVVDRQIGCPRQSGPYTVIRKNGSGAYPELSVVSTSPL